MNWLCILVETNIKYKNRIEEYLKLHGDMLQLIIDVCHYALQECAFDHGKKVLPNWNQMLTDWEQYWTR